MKKIHPASLLKYNNNCKEHRRAYRAINGFNFNIDIETIKTLLEKTDFKGGVIFDQEDLEHFVVEGNFMTGINFEDEMLDDWKYLFDAYNVYFSKDSHEYSRDEKLTEIWRKIMIKTYGANYIASLETHIQAECSQEIAEIYAMYDKQIKNIELDI